MSGPITDPSVLQALAEFDETNPNTEISFSVTEHLESQFEQAETIPIITENPSVIPLALAALEIGSDRADGTGEPVVISFDITNFFDALVDQSLSPRTRLDVADAIARVPGFDDSKDFEQSKQDQDFLKTFHHAAAMAKGYLENAQKEFAAR